MTRLHDQARRAKVDGLRNLARWLEEHPEYAEHVREITTDYYPPDRESFDKSVAALGPASTQQLGEWVEVTRDFGGGVKLSVLGLPRIFESNAPARSLRVVS